MIDSNLIRNMAPEATGQEVHIDHTGCTAGIDTKRRLYIKRVPGGIVAYCHHCNEAGFTRDKDAEGKRLRRWLSGAPEDIPDVSEYRNSEHIFTSLPSGSGMNWLMKYHVNPTGILVSGINSDPYLVGLKLISSEGGSHGLQIRNTRPGAKPKYITRFFDLKNKERSTWFHHGSLSLGKVLFITEDYLSAFRIFMATGETCIALLGTTMSTDLLQKIAEKEYQTIYIWLDPDTAGIEGSVEISKRLQFFYPSTTYISILNYGKEPKEFSPTELQRELSPVISKKLA